MNIFLLSLAVLFAGGIFTLLSYRNFRVMKIGYVVVTTIGSALGLFSIALTYGAGQALHISIPWLHIFTLSLSLDPLSALFLAPIFIISPLTALYGYHYMVHEAEARRISITSSFFLLLVISMALVAAADNLVTFLLVWELMSLSSFFLVMHEYQKEETRRAGYIYFVFAQVGAMALFAAFALAYSQSGSYQFSDLAALPEGIKCAVFILALLGFGSKAGIFPLHIWLPHAHPAAPSHISAIMSGVMIKMGVYGIIRIYFSLGLTSLFAGQLLIFLGVVSGVLGVVYALGKGDLKKVLAYSSVENIGIILIGLGVGMIGVATGNKTMASFAFAGALLHLLNHSLFKTLLFLGAGAVVQSCKTRRIDELGGLLKRMPLTGKAFVGGAVAISGLPPFNGFIGEFLIYYGAFAGLSLGGSAFLFTTLAILALALIGGLALSCFTRLLGIVFLGEPRSKQAASARDSRPCMTIPMVALALFCLFIGLFPAPLVNFTFAALGSIAHFPLVADAEVVNLTAHLARAARLIFVVFLLLSLLQRVLYRFKSVTSEPTWGCGFTQASAKVQYTGTSYAMSIVHIFKPVIQLTVYYTGITRIFPQKTKYETGVSDRAEIILQEQIVAPLLYFLGKFRWIQHGHIQLYIAYIVVAIGILLLCI